MLCRDTGTKEHDAQAFKYLSWALYPLVACYAVYALIYHSHKSWYSWAVNSLVGAVYAFGFLAMTPQVQPLDICCLVSCESGCFGGLIGGKTLLYQSHKSWYS